MLKILGYPNKYSVAPGEDITFMVSTLANHSYQAELVHVIHGDCNPAGPGLKYKSLPSSINGAYTGKHQHTAIGSYMQVMPAPPFFGAEGVSGLFMMWPTLLKRPSQSLLSYQNTNQTASLDLLLVNNRLQAALYVEGEQTTLTLEKNVIERHWYTIAFSICTKTQTLTLSQRALENHPFQEQGHIPTVKSFTTPLMAKLTTHLNKTDNLLTLACKKDPTTSPPTTSKHYNGKLDSISLLQGVHSLDKLAATLQRPYPAWVKTTAIALWDFANNPHAETVNDHSTGNYPATLVNLPARAMKGWNWNGESHNWQQKPEHYGAIHFHEDDLYDANWQPSFTLTIPQDLASGAYAIHLTTGPNTPTELNETFISFFVRPPRTKKYRPNAPKLAFLAPTCSYLAYANHSEHINARQAERVIGRLLRFGHADMYLYEHPELGLSLYDLHADGSGVCYSSRLRPVLNFTMQYSSWLGGHGSGLWQYNADTHLLDWLTEKQFAFDIITDEDLHTDGHQLLADYHVVLTGTHPEYHSTPMWDSMKTWLDKGGRLMYLGANGWYWRIAFHPELPGVIEVRRAEDGIRTWAAEPGEYYHAFNGELGGLWRRIGRPPNLMTGVGFIAQGFDVSTYYRRTQASYDPRAAFIFANVKDEIIGNFGLIGGGAAGLEMDCVQSVLGSPPHTLCLAQSEEHSPLMMLVNEEFGVVPPNLSGDQNERVHADLAFFETNAGGAVFSVSSIAWCGSLSHANYQNNVSQITENVLKRFLNSTPFPTK